MTWDVLLLRVRPGIETAEDLSEDAVVPLGSPATVRAAIQRACPGAQFTDETAGSLRAAGFTIQFSLGDEDPVRGILLLISVECSGALDAITTLCAANDWRAFDMNTEDFLTLA